MSQQPNVLFIFADQLGSTYMGCYGHPDVKTPNLDRLAGTSVMFENAYTVSPLCTPFRGALFTGRYPHQTEIFRNFQSIPDDERTLAQCFNEAGYATSYIGKWHLGGQKIATWVPHERRGGFQDFVGWDCGHAKHLDQEYFDNDSDESLIMEGHETEALTDITCNKLAEKAASDKPFCMFVSYQAPHPYCDPPEEYWSLYRDQPLSFRPTVDHDAKFCGYGHCNQEPQHPKEWTERYFGEITQLDEAIGRLMAHVEALGLLENTIIVFTSDHGDMAGSHSRFEKGISYEEATRIPVFVKTPGMTQGLKTPAPFSSIDFMPTLLGLCGLPTEPTCEGMDHTSLILSQSAYQKRDHVFMQMEDWSCVCAGDEKLTMSPDGTEPTMFFRLTDDPYEQNNLVAEPAEQERIAELSAIYREWYQAH